MSSTEGVIARR